MIEAADYLIQAACRHRFGNERFSCAFERLAFQKLSRIELSHRNRNLTIGITKNCQAVKPHLPDREITRLSKERFTSDFIKFTGFPKFTHLYRANFVEISWFFEIMVGQVAHQNRRLTAALIPIIDESLLRIHEEIEDGPWTEHVLAGFRFQRLAVKAISVVVFPKFFNEFPLTEVSYFCRFSQIKGKIRPDLLLREPKKRAVGRVE